MGVLRWRPCRATALLAVAFATGLAVAVAPAAGALPAATGPVSPVPAYGTPALDWTGVTQLVRKLVQCGGTMYAVGQFTEITQRGVIHHVDNAISFSATAPFTLTKWAPDVNGIVNSIAFSGGNCGDAYLGGMFTSIDGTAVKNIAEVSTSTGKVVAAFGHSASGEVQTLLAVRGRLIAGGEFSSINGGPDKYMASLNPVTGKDDGFIRLNISGHYQYPGVVPNSTDVYNQQLSHGGTLELVEGTFTSVGGLPRQQIFMLNLSGPAAKVTGWTSSGFSKHCYVGHPFYIKAAAWSPDDSAVYIATTGRYPLAWNGKFPLTGLCDAAAAFPATQTQVSPKWVNYTGCWTLLSVAADSSAVYVGGHQKYENNPDGCKYGGPGAVPDFGLAGLNPATGSVLRNSSGTAGLYSRGRGHGADDMLLTSAGLWIASDNYHNTSQCGGKYGHAGICFLPYP